MVNEKQLKSKRNNDGKTLWNSSGPDGVYLRQQFAKYDERNPNAGGIDWTKCDKTEAKYIKAIMEAPIESMKHKTKS